MFNYRRSKGPSVFLGMKAMQMIVGEHILVNTQQD